MRQVVVTGLGALSPLGPDVPALARALRDGAGAIARTVEGSLMPYQAVAPEAPPAPRVSRPVRSSLAVAAQAWRHAGLHRRAVDERRVAVVVGGNNLNGAQSAAAATRLARDPALVPPRLALQYQDTDHVAVLSETFGIRGEGLTVGGASASGVLALIHGTRLVQWGAADVCLVVAPMAEPSPAQVRSFLNLGAMVPTVGDGPGGPFDRGHRGFVHGPAAAAMVLEAPGAVPALAEVAGYATGLDANSGPDPSVDGEADVLVRALAAAGAEPGEVDLVGAHGTGSPLGDRTEAAALRRVFGDRTPWVNAVKGLAGHALTAAGLLGAVAVVVQLRDGFVHPNPWLRDPIDGAPRLAGPKALDCAPRSAVSSAFGFGGFNSAVLWRTPR